MKQAAAGKAVSNELLFWLFVVSAGAAAAPAAAALAVSTLQWATRQHTHCTPLVPLVLHTIVCAVTLALSCRAVRVPCCCAVQPSSSALHFQLTHTSQRPLLTVARAAPPTRFPTPAGCRFFNPLLLCVHCAATRVRCTAVGSLLISTGSTLRRPLYPGCPVDFRSVSVLPPPLSRYCALRS